MGLFGVFGPALLRKLSGLALARHLELANWFLVFLSCRGLRAASLELQGIQVRMLRAPWTTNRRPELIFTFWLCATPF
jgi:hypothetical protein